MKLNEARTDMATENFGVFERALNLNSVVLLISSRCYLSNVDVGMQSGITATRTKIFKCVLRNRFADDDQFPHKQLRAFANFVLDSCADLKKLLIEIHFRAADDVESYAAEQFDPYVQRIKALSDELEIEMADFDTRGCDLIIAMAARFPEQTLNDAIENNHEVMQIGEHRDDDEWPAGWLSPDMISREVKLLEKITARYYLDAPN